MVHKAAVDMDCPIWIGAAEGLGGFQKQLYGGLGGQKKSGGTIASDVAVAFVAAIDGHELRTQQEREREGAGLHAVDLVYGGSSERKACVRMKVGRKRGKNRGEKTFGVGKGPAFCTKRNSTFRRQDKFDGAVFSGAYVEQL